MSTQVLQKRDIIVEEVFPHTVETLWKTLTTGDLIGRWLMQPNGFAPVPGNRFTFQTKAAGGWDGVIQCEVLEVIPHQRFSYSWKGGHAENEGYGSLLDTVVTWTLTRTDEGTRVRLVHAGFEMPKNETAFTNMGSGWKKVVPSLAGIANAQD